MEQTLDELCAKYWEMHLRNPVLFEEAIRNIFRLDENIDVIVEIGPHRALSRPVNEAQTLHASKQNRLYLATMIRNTDTAMNMMRLGGALVLNGVDVNLRAVNGLKKQLNRRCRSSTGSHKTCLPTRGITPPRYGRMSIK